MSEDNITTCSWCPVQMEIGYIVCPSCSADRDRLLAENAELRRERDAMRESLIHACHLQEATHDNRIELWAMRQTANDLSAPFSHERVAARHDALSTVVADGVSADAERLRTRLARVEALGREAVELACYGRPGLSDGQIDRLAAIAAELESK